MIVTNFVAASNYKYISNEFSMFLYSFCCMTFSLTSKKLNASLATWCAPKRSRSRNIAVRNVFRALIREQHFLFLLMFETCYVFHHILRSCPPRHNLRNVLGDLQLRSACRPVPPSPHLGAHGRRLSGILAALAATSSP